MFGRLLPREGRFFDLFNAHAAQVVRAAHELKALMESYDEREQHARIIDEAEHAADRITAETIRLLHKTFITPLDRDHIHQLVNAIDDICDLIQDTSESTSMYDVRAVSQESVFGRLRTFWPDDDWGEVVRLAAEEFEAAPPVSPEAEPGAAADGGGM